MLVTEIRWEAAIDENAHQEPRDWALLRHPEINE